MTSRWFTNGTVRNPGARCRLFCFPYAGGSPHEFRAWGERLPNAEVLGVFYPGRASRFREPVIDNVAEMVEAIKDEIEPYLDKPVAFFGHSMGALISFELARSLRRADMPLPKMLCVSACAAPHLMPIPPIIHHLPDDEFIQGIRDLGGTPEAILTHDELLAMMLPTLRGDLKLVETYRYQEGSPLDIPLYAVGGLEDAIMVQENVLAWQRYAAAKWESRFFRGEHFFLRDTDSLLLPYLQAILNREMMPY